MIRFIAITQKENETFLYYIHKKNQHTFLKVIKSYDGHRFEAKAQYVFVLGEKNREEKQFNWQDVHIVKQKETYLLTFKTTDKAKISYVAYSEDLIHWQGKEKITIPQEAQVVIPDYRYKNRYVAYVGGKTIAVSFSGNFITWKPGETVLEARKDSFDNDTFEVGSVTQTNEHILLIYYGKQKNTYTVGAAAFDKKNPTRLLWRSDEPIFEHDEKFHNDNIVPLGVVHHEEGLILYWIINESTIYSVSLPLPSKHAGLKDKDFSVKLNRTDKNPIIKPVPHKPWESRATFNSAAVYEDGKVHFVYRALGDSDLSVLGYATSRDGITIDERSDEPIYIPREPFETPGGNRLPTFADHFVSGGGYGGIEDPKLTKIDNRFYMTYVAFDGCNPPRLALTSISVKDFLKKKWKNWEKPKLISVPGMVNKSAAIFPEKVNGKYVVFHRVYPNILVDYVDDLKFDNYLRGDYFIPPRKTHWDSKKLSAGAPPIKTKDGWLLVYHAVGHQDSSRYKIGAMLLDKKNPTKVLYRSNQPIISPDEHYENAGHKAGVVYPCGAVVKDDELFVYYGGADTVVCAASQKLDLFLEQLKYTQEPKMRRVQTPRFN